MYEVISFSALKPFVCIDTSAYISFREHKVFLDDFEAQQKHDPMKKDH